MDSPKVVFRVDGSSAIGLGHISRCCALADILKNDFEILFYTRSNNQLVIENIKQHSSAVFSLIDTVSYDEEAIQWIAVLKGDEIVVLDGYNFNTNYQQQIKNKGCKLVCIDDIHAYHFLADVVINHAPGTAKKDYSVEPYTQLYLGTEYVLLRKIFLDAALKKPALLDLESSPVLICFGGADPNNITKQTLEETMHLFPQRKINVVVGVGYLHLEALKKTIGSNNFIKLHININAEKMLALMQRSHIAVTSASTIAFEYMCVKGNLFLKCTADNQKDIYAELTKKQWAYSFPELQYKYSATENITNQVKLIDGRSDLRLINIFKNIHEQ